MRYFTEVYMTTLLALVYMVSGDFACHTMHRKCTSNLLALNMHNITTSYTLCVSTIHWLYMYSSCLPHTSSHLFEHLTHGNVAELHKVDDINTNTLYVYVSVGGPDMLTQLQYISLRHYTERCLHGWKFQ